MRRPSLLDAYSRMTMMVLTAPRNRYAVIPKAITHMKNREKRCDVVNVMTRYL